MRNENYAVASATLDYLRTGRSIEFVAIGYWYCQLIFNTQLVKKTCSISIKEQLDNASGRTDTLTTCRNIDKIFDITLTRNRSVIFCFIAHSLVVFHQIYFARSGSRGPRTVFASKDPGSPLVAPRILQTFCQRKDWVPDFVCRNKFIVIVSPLQPATTIPLLTIDGGARNREWKERAIRIERARIIFSTFDFQANRHTFFIFAHVNINSICIAIQVNSAAPEPRYPILG